MYKDKGRNKGKTPSEFIAVLPDHLQAIFQDGPDIPPTDTTKPVPSISKKHRKQVAPSIIWVDERPLSVEDSNLEKDVNFSGKSEAEPVEKDPTGKTAHEPGAKLDSGKAPIFQGVLDYFPRAISAVAEVSAFGAEKYAWKGWESVPNGFIRYSDAMSRHIVKEAFGEIDDGENGTGCLHAAQVAWNALARLELKLREGEENAADNSS